MAEEKHHHHFGFLHGKNHGEVEGEVNEKKHHKHIGTAAALGAAAVGAAALGAYALHEKKTAEKAEVPEDSQKHKIKEEVAAVAALGAAGVAIGAAGVALHKHHDKKKEAEE